MMYRSALSLMIYFASPTVPRGGGRECQAGDDTKLEGSQARASDSQCQEEQQSNATMPGVLNLNYRNARMPTDQLLRCQMTVAPDPVVKARCQCQHQTPGSVPARIPGHGIKEVKWSGEARCGQLGVRVILIRGQTC